MPDELTVLKKIGSTEPAPAEVEQRLRRSLVDQITGPAMRPSSGRRRTLMRVGVAFAAAALIVVAGGLLTGRGGEPSVAARAYAAISPPTGIMHFVVVGDQALLGVDPPVRYQEYWIDLADPRRKRVVWSNPGRVVEQIVFVTRAVPHGTIQWKGHPGTAIVQAPTDPTALYPGRDIRAGQDPSALYREALRSGSVISEQKTRWGGHDAYELVLKYKTPYGGLSDKLVEGETEIFIVDRHTYFPIETELVPGNSLALVYSVLRYARFEILPDTPQNRLLLDPVRNPAPFRP